MNAQAIFEATVPDCNERLTNYASMLQVPPTKVFEVVNIHPYLFNGKPRVSITAPPQVLMHLIGVFSLEGKDNLIAYQRRTQ